MKTRQPWGLMPTLLVALLLVGGGFALYATGVMNPAQVSAEDLSRVLIVAASPNETGAVVGQIIVELELTSDRADVSPVSPALGVTIPGTSYSTLADAYPFGGGVGTAAALARARDEQPLPYVAIGAEELSTAVDAAGGVRVDLPAPMNVFDGEHLYALKAGKQTLTANELQAVLKGAPYLGERQREDLERELSSALIHALGAYPEALQSADTNLSEGALARLKDALQR